MSRYTGTGTNANGMLDIGLPWMVAQVETVVTNSERRHATVKDSFGKRHTIPIGPRRGKGPFPRVGEVWILDRTLGHWSFAGTLEERLPVVTGTTDNIPALNNLLKALEDIGLIVDNTTRTRIRATHTHIHPGCTSGTTGSDFL